MISPGRPAGRSPCSRSAWSRLCRRPLRRLLVVLPGLDDALFIGEHGCLDPVAESQFQQDACHMGLRGRLTDHHSGGDLGIRQAVRDEFEDLTLAGGQRGQDPVPLRRAGAAARP